ncbi:hypothetical protein SCP_0803740 [Sparassis crispa]|uniref:Aminoglycoside phosphotransferase domain-containing protein n=1 Tax=Sparassis crispa TaxID=139825 RepID=A0A401GUG5_9APHY|nr:hypothetical protein SCP_0803740 [Sparassis crispa]GBE85852.1 hypothetical protein SCP_0803740 [Sparassis crispa]
MTIPVHVVVLGGPQSGKSTLIARMNKNVYRRAGDRRVFRFSMADCGDDVEFASSCEGSHFVLSTFDLMEGYAGLSQAVVLGRKVLETAHTLQIWLVGTKLDLIPQNYSDMDLEVRQYAAECPWQYDMRFVAVSSVTNQGIDNLKELIVNHSHPIEERRSTAVIIHTLVNWFLGHVATTFSLPVPGNKETPDPVELDDAKVDALLETPEAVAWDDKLKTYSTFWNASTVHKITPSLVVKRFTRTELENMLYVRRHTKIPVPQPRCLNLSDWLAMDLVDGQMLVDCWDSLSFFMQFRVACTLRSYISQLHQLTRDVPGPVDGGSFSGALFDETEYGPFPSSRSFRLRCEMIAHIGWARYVRHLRSEQRPIPPPPIVGGDWSLSFVHADLGPSNMILSKEGVLWIIDWADAGFFPHWLEAVGMQRYFDTPRVPKSWRWLQWFVTGSCPAYKNLWGYFMADAHRF